MTGQISNKSFLLLQKIFDGWFLNGMSFIDVASWMVCTLKFWIQSETWVQFDGLWWSVMFSNGLQWSLNSDGL